MASNNKNLFSSEQLEQIIAAVTGLVEAQSKIVQMGLRREVAKLMASSAYLFAILLIGSLVVLAGSAALAIALGQLLGNPLYGVLAVTGIYGIILALLLSNMKKWQERISDQIEAKLEKIDLQKLLGAESIEASTDGISINNKKTDEHEQRLEKREKAIDQRAGSIPEATKEAER